ncbi:hypothetical protein BDZ97DRAFT_123837 [Flammula alnicola]|nr:hypothetical protein BDZ97DRAFT_123837 [Flammula alnicola]
MYSKAFFSLVLAAHSIVSVHAITCNDKHLLESKPLTMPSGDVITMERFTCSNSISNSTVPARRLQPSSAIDRRHSLDPNTKRAASQCTTSNCVCGVPCFFQRCANAATNLNAADCTVLANSLTSKSGTFIVTAGQGVGFILQTCEYATFNGNPTQDIEYCFDDLGVSATELFDICTAAQQGECGGTLGALIFTNSQNLT